MEPLAFVEVIGRHGEVVSRHPVWRWPSRIGRGYEADVIIDDPFVAPAHVTLDVTPDGRFVVEDLQTVNGMAVLPSSQRRASAEVGPEDTIRIGHTQLRVRPRSYTVPAERAIRRGATYRRPLMFMIAAAIVLVTFILDAFVTVSDNEEKALVAMSVLAVIIGVVVWIAIWSLASRTAGRRANFAAHGVIACAGVLGLEIWTTGTGYLAFGLDAGWVESLSVAGASALFGYVVYRHLRLASRARRQVHATVAATVVVVAFGGGAMLTNLMTAMDLSAQMHSRNLKAPAFLMVPGVSPSSYMAGAEDLKRAVDELAARE